MNIHTPERQSNESQSAYRERQAASRAHVRAITCRGVGGGISSRQQLRDSMRQSGRMSKRRRFSDVLMSAWARKRRDAKKAQEAA